jgi:hypothetical protein
MLGRYSPRICFLLVWVVSVTGEQLEEVRGRTSAEILGVSTGWPGRSDERDED